MHLRSLFAALPGLLFFSPLQAVQTPQPLNAETFAGLELRAIGPAASGGRISDIELDPRNRNVWYVTTAAGGVWKTTSAGTSWTPIFDRQGSYSIGVARVDPRNSNVVWIGTGENTSQRSVGFGDGVYKSEDAGRTWSRMGLAQSEHIGEIVIDPRNSAVVYVAAQGPLWAPGGERGLYKTVDGGRSWNRVLYVSENTGISDVVINPANPDILYAASYQRRRHLGMQIAGGPEAAIYKSVDGGVKWDKLSNGLPGGDVGRIGLALSTQNPDVVYAHIAAAGRNGGFFRSADAGATWVKQSDYVPGDPQYYMELFPDPHHPGRIYSLDVNPRVTDDEGKTWRAAIPNGGVHVDHHAFAFDPSDPEHILNGNDGGLYQSFDSGKSWQWFGNLPISQFYNIDVDDAQPFYNVYGGLQDNGSLMGPSRTLFGGIPNYTWISIGGGDGMQPRAEANGQRFLYVQSQNGSINRLDQHTAESVGIRPANAQGQPPLRFTWNAPLAVSPHSSTRLYFGAQQLMRSDDRGTTWRAVSGDLTRNLNRDTMQIMGRVWGPEAVGRHLYTNTLSTITSIEESPLQQGLLIVGTDDGLLQISENAGESWRQSQLPGLPALGHIVDIAASRHDANTIYVVAQNYQRGDFKPYVFRSSDRGRSWTSISANVPARHVAWSIAEDHVNRSLLFLGTEFGLFFSLDAGQQWTQLSGGVPTVMFRDLAIQRRENDLVAGTFGRGIYVLDDYAPLRAITPAVLAQEGTLLPVRDAWAYNQRRAATDRGSFTASNPPYGALLTYYLREAAPGSYVIEIKNAAGEVVNQVAASTKAGVQRVAWDLRAQPRETAAAANAAAGEEEGPRRPPQGRPVPPGEYTAQLGRRVNNSFTAIGSVQRFQVKALPPIPNR